MRTRKGLEDTVTGILISQIDECNHNGEIARKTASNIIDYFVEEENLIIHHVSKQSELLFAFMEYLEDLPKFPDNQELICDFLVKQSKL